MGAQVASFDHRRRGARQSAYRAVYYAHDGSDLRLPPSVRFRRRLLGEARIACTGTGGEVQCVPPS